MKIVLAYNQQYLENKGINTDIAKALITYFETIKGSKKLKYIISKIKNKINEINENKIQLIKNPELINQIIPFKYQTPINKIMDEAKVDKETAEHAYQINPTYAVWTAKLIKNKNIIKGEDDDKVKERLIQFSEIINSPQFPNELKNINQYKYFGELAKMLDQNSINKSKKQRQKQKSSQGAKIIYDKNNVKVTKITNATTATNLAKNTEWCVKDISYALQYISQGPLYMFEVDDERVALIHQESGQIKDVYDNPLEDSSIILKIDPIIEELKLNNEIGDFQNYNNIKTKTRKFNQEFKNNYNNIIEEIKTDPKKYNLLFPENQTEEIKTLIAKKFEQTILDNQPLNNKTIQLYNQLPRNVKPYLSNKIIKDITDVSQKFIEIKLEQLKENQKISEKYLAESLCDTYQEIPSEIKQQMPTKLINEIHSVLYMSLKRNPVLFTTMPYSVKKNINEDDLKNIIDLWFYQKNPFYSISQYSEFPNELLENDTFAKALIEGVTSYSKKDITQIKTKLNNIPPESLDFISNENIKNIHDNIIQNAINQISYPKHDPEVDMCYTGFHAYNTEEDCKDEYPHKEYSDEVYKYSKEDDERYFDFKNPQTLETIYDAVGKSWVKLFKEKNYDEIEEVWNLFFQYYETINRYEKYLDEVEQARRNNWEQEIEGYPPLLSNAPEDFIEQYTDNPSTWENVWKEYISDTKDTESLFNDLYLDFESKIQIAVEAGLLFFSEYILETLQDEFKYKEEEYNEIFRQYPKILTENPTMFAYVNEYLDQDIYKLALKTFINEITNNYEYMIHYAIDSGISENIPEVKQAIYQYWYRKILSNIEYYKTPIGLQEIKNSPAKDLLNYMEIKNALFNNTQFDQQNNYANWFNWFGSYKLSQFIKNNKLRKF